MMTALGPEGRASSEQFGPVRAGRHTCGNQIQERRIIKAIT